MKKQENLFYASGVIDGINFLALSNGKGIIALHLNIKEIPFMMTKLHKDDPYMFNIFTELEEYFNLKRKKFTVQIDPTGTPFQKKVWSTLQKIPYGKTISYKELAEKSGSVARAVGQANAANPIPIIIPCHRVINFSGKLGGYSCGLEIKEKLLELEGALSLELF